MTYVASLVILVMLLSAFSYVHLSVEATNPQATVSTEPPQYNNTKLGGAPQYAYYNNSNAELDALYRAQSVMLGNPEISAWFVSHHVNKSLLLPYVTLTPIGVNPYDYSQGSVTVNSTTYAIYAYELPNGTVIAFWLLGNNVVKPYTYQSTPNMAFSTGENVYVEAAAGHQVEGSTSNSNQVIAGATYESVVFSDLSSPPGCSTNVYWAYGNLFTRSCSL